MASLCLHGLYQLVLPDTWPQHLRTHDQQYQREIELEKVHKVW